MNSKCPLCEDELEKTPTLGRWECRGCGALLLSGRAKAIHHVLLPQHAPQTGTQYPVGGSLVDDLNDALGAAAQVVGATDPMQGCDAQPAPDDAWQGGGGDFSGGGATGDWAADPAPDPSEGSSDTFGGDTGGVDLGGGSDFGGGGDLGGSSDGGSSGGDF